MNENEFETKKELSQVDGIKKAMLRFFSSNLMLAFTIAYTAVCVLAICGGWVNELLAIKSDLYDDTAFGNFIDILAVVGLWLIYASARRGELKAGGIKVVKISFVLDYVFTVIGYVFAAIGCFIGLFITKVITLTDAEALAALESLMPAAAIASVTFAFLVAVETLRFIYVKKFINRVKDVAEGKTPKEGKAAFAAITAILRAILGVLPVVIEVIHAQAFVTVVNALIAQFSEKLTALGDVAALAVGAFGALALTFALLDAARQIFAAVIILKLNAAENEERQNG